MNINLRQIEVFAAVMEQLSFTKAADQLYLSQPTVSSHIEQLEQALHTQLFVRTDKKHIVPTEAGKRMYVLVQDVLRACRTLEAEFLPDDAADQTRLVTISASTIPSRYLLPQLLAAYVKKNPSMRFSILKGDSEYAIERLTLQEAQIAFAGTKIREDEYHFEPLCKDRIVLITPNTPEFRRLQAKGALGKELMRYPIVMREAGSGTKKEADKYLDHVGIDRNSLHIVAQMNDLEMIKQSVVNGLGISIISEWVVEEEIKQGSLLRFLLDDTEFYREIYLAYHKKRHLTVSERAFIAFVKRYFAKPQGE